jgi:spermidine/putrescine-binding protein
LYNFREEEEKMEKDSKLTEVRNYILDLLEDGVVETGDKLPGAREISAKSGVSFFVVQHAIELLVRDGVLETVPRKGTFLAENWQDRILLENFNIFSYRHYPWFAEFKDRLSEKLPWLRVRLKFPHGMFDMRPSNMARRDHEDYLDLSDCLDDLYSDKSIFLTHPFKSFYIEGKLVGIPFVFSPRLIYCNIKFLEKAGCEFPESNWTWDDFLKIIKSLRKKGLKNDQIVNWNRTAWFNFTFSAAKGIICPEDEDPVKLDSEEFRAAFKFCLDIYKALDGYTLEYHEYFELFQKGNAAFFISPRVDVCFDPEIKALPLPRLGHRDCVPLQTTDIICIRKECNNPDMAKSLVKFMLSEEMQGFMAKQKYRIPIRKTSAFESLDLNNPIDTLFLKESNNMSAAYGLDSPELFNMIFYNIPDIWEKNMDIDEFISKIAFQCRGYLEIVKHKDMKNINRMQFCY